MNSRRLSIAIAGTLLIAACGSNVGSDAATAQSAGAAASTLPPTSATTSPPPTTTTTSTPTTAPPSTVTTTSLPPPTSTTLAPVFAYDYRPVTETTVWASWREGCPLHFDKLSLLNLTYWDFDGQVRTGELVINTSVAADVVTAFEGLFDIGFQIERIELVDNYGGDDKAAMAANVTSGFNCRYVDGTESWSNHAFGLAVDINPLINPWARDGNVLPLEGEPYTNRDLELPGMINLGDEAITIFEEVGWSWGGVWQSADYMHFSKPGN